MITDTELLEAALAGLRQQQQQLDEKISELRRRLNLGRGRAVAPGQAPARKRRVLSASARRRIAAAQKRRWAKFHQARQKAAGRAKPKPVAHKKSASKPAAKSAAAKTETAAGGQ